MQNLNVSDKSMPSLTQANSYIGQTSAIARDMVGSAETLPTHPDINNAPVSDYLK